ncbi:MAG: hypothetical protein QNJ42_21250 [Crocosphaera sp.]|nr:hypothetical protein [Crocosphaera sp.]
MSLFGVLQVIIAIIFIYLTLSLLVSEIQEAWASFREFRAKNLKESIAILLGEMDENKTLTNAIYETNRMKSLNQYTSTWVQQSQKSQGPSSISKEDFADAVLEYLNTKLGSVLTNGMQVRTIIDQIHRLNDKTLEPLLNIAQSMKLKKDDPDLEDFRKELERLFEKSEEKTIEVYKRNAKGVSFLIGFLLAMFLNVDFFYIVEKVAENPEVATSLTENAEKFLNENENTKVYQKYQECLKTNSQNCQQEFLDVQKEFAASIPQTNLSEIFGWGTAIQNISTSQWLLKIPGWLISAIAMAMGAPFWFNALKKFLDVRNTAKPFEQKPTAPKK